MKTKLTDKGSIRKIIDEMSLYEKSCLLTGSTPHSGGKNAEHGIPAPLMIDGGTGFSTHEMLIEALHAAAEEVDGSIDPAAGMSPYHLIIEPKSAMEDMGHASEKMKGIIKRAEEIMDETRPADVNLGCYPPGMFLGATMNPEIVEQCGEAMGREASACHIDVLLGSPNVNLHRDPRYGRLFEGYSEDPYVVSKLAPSFVKGVQKAGVAANVKHFAANNQETDRKTVNELISERALRELYLPGFKACIEVGCKTVMSAYNKVNGIHCAQNKWLLTDVLRNDWGFQGFVMSDWGAINDRVKSLLAGNDVCMPGPESVYEVVKAVEDGILPEELINQACENYLRVVLETPRVQGQKYTEIDTTYSMEVAYATACEGITLLKNDGVLPLNKQTNVSFYGHGSKKFVECGGGSAGVVSNLSTNMFDETKKIIGSDKVAYEQVEEKTDAVIVTIGAEASEGQDRPDMEMNPTDKAVLKQAMGAAKQIGKPLILVLNIAAPIELADYVDDADAILCVYIPGMGGGKAAADILFGNVNPSGKLPLTMPKHYRDTPTYLNYPGENQISVYGEDIYVGYRYYDKKQVEPLFPFGYGLSYTTFELSDLRIPKQVFLDRENVQVSVEIKNTGNYAGAEVIQLYVTDVESTLARPIKELKEFQKVFLRPGESKKVTFELSKEMLAYYDIKVGAFVTETGMFEILVGTSSRDIVLNGAFEGICKRAYAITEKTSIGEIAADLEVVKVIERHLKEIDFLETVKSPLQYMPGSSFEASWKETVVPLLSEVSEEERENIYKNILADFAKII